MNTANRTVKGQLEGESPKIDVMKKWLQTTGSPSSRIDKAVFSNEKDITEYSLGQNFEIRHWVGNSMILYAMFCTQKLSQMNF